MDETESQIAALDYEDRRQEAAARLQYQIDFLQTAFKGLNLINGGAIVALFTLLSAEKVALTVAQTRWSFAAFAAGLVFNLLAAFFAFRSQFHYKTVAIHRAVNARHAIHGLEAKHEVTNTEEDAAVYLWLCNACIAVSLLSFIVGAGLTLAVS